jgi:hypothetical protein
VNTPGSKSLEFNELALGFHLPDTDLSNLDYHDMLTSKSDWNVVAGIILAAREGNFSHIQDVYKVMARNDSYLIWCACVNVVGYAGSWNDLTWLAGALRNLSVNSENDPFIGMLLGTSCDLRTVNEMLQLYMSTDDLDTLNQLRGDLSSLLEPSDDVLFDGVEGDGGGLALPSVDARERYSLLVRSHRDALLSKLPDPQLPVFEGRTYSVINTARNLMAQIEADEEHGERFFREKMVFEAATGTDCSRFFDDLGRLQRIEAAAVLEDFFDRDDLHKFQDGQRYFFGHAIPL